MSALVRSLSAARQKGDFYVGKLQKGAAWAAEKGHTIGARNDPGHCCPVGAACRAEGRFIWYPNSTEAFMILGGDQNAWEAIIEAVDWGGQ